MQNLVTKRPNYAIKNSVVNLKFELKDPLHATS
jgi:hypothetical protein